MQCSLRGLGRAQYIIRITALLLTLGAAAPALGDTSSWPAREEQSKAGDEFTARVYVIRES
ncbi:hypothetical protein [Alloalcanivorax mobilis]|uniref:hypothetical protein n=1 Tax=Alloalcanivorax mobilis TaxID=2019569 RepID=UPI000C7868EF|nr:hypothetical protein [Alloalcanivorax mobilis]